MVKDKSITTVKGDYNQILIKIIDYIEQSKLRAFSEVNRSLLIAYWNIGKELSQNDSYGASVVEKLSKDLRMRYSGARGYSTRNLWNMKKFYETYQKAKLFGGSESKSDSETCQKMQTLSAELLFSTSWSNHIAILDFAKRLMFEIIQFYKVYPIVHALSAQLIWSHYSGLIIADNNLIEVNAS